MSVFVGFILIVLSCKPKFPYPLYPHVQISPFAFNAAKWFVPETIFGYVFPCFPFTFTLTAAYALFFSLYNLIYVFPSPVAVTTPSSVTVATLSSIDVNLQFPCSISFFNKLNPAVALYVIFSPVSPAF